MFAAVVSSILPTVRSEKKRNLCFCVCFVFSLVPSPIVQRKYSSYFSVCCPQHSQCFWTVFLLYESKKPVCTMPLCVQCFYKFGQTSMLAGMREFQPPKKSGYCPPLRLLLSVFEGFSIGIESQRVTHDAILPSACFCFFCIGEGWKLPGWLLCSERSDAWVEKTAGTPKWRRHPEEQSHHGELK